ncbi:MAG: hypothetical protein N0E48_00575, partial [Candidatus Thiodiazotropha endolucinida]|nr:hypothetical protein [Candidatus Thiodiazotropha taylori]MCW4341861.1 hypothetical protein [Candidatus Thiodiazotropha endolucinida]
RSEASYCADGVCAYSFSARFVKEQSKFSKKAHPTLPVTSRVCYLLNKDAAVSFFTISDMYCSNHFTNINVYGGLMVNRDSFQQPVG